MKENARNFAVGLTVVAAMAVLGGMILVFTGLPGMFQRGYPLHISSYTTHGVNSGDMIHFGGMPIGRVTTIRFTDPENPAAGVTFEAKIKHGVKLPGNCLAYFFGRGMIGGAYIGLKADGPPRIRDGKELELLPTDGSIVMEGKFVGHELIPSELTDAMKSISNLAENLNLLIAPPEPTGVPASAPGEPGAPGETQPAAAGLKGTVEKLNLALDALITVMGDAENQKNIKSSLANFSKATAATTDAMGAIKSFAEEARKTAIDAQATAKDFSKLAMHSQEKIDDLAGKLIETAGSVSKLMATINRVVTKIDAGKGTAGKLINDPHLHHNMLDAIGQLNELLIETRQLVKVWKEEGVKLKMK